MARHPLYDRLVMAAPQFIMPRHPAAPSKQETQHGKEGHVATGQWLYALVLMVLEAQIISSPIACRKKGRKLDK